MDTEDVWGNAEFSSAFRDPLPDRASHLDTLDRSRFAALKSARSGG
ncbi:MAG: hypothetical protein IPH63_05440 [Flavobacteriales bacterium]|nr:hypothetical protein [Flavobacteriales bacterium]